MKNRVAQFILLAGLVSCAKNYDSFEATTPQFSQPTQIVSSDTVVDNESSSSARTYVTRTYWLTSVSPVNEGSSVWVKLNTTNVSKGTLVAYTVTGVDAADLTSGSLSGNFTVGSNGTDSIKYTLKADQKTEGTEALKVTAKTAVLSVSVNDVSTAAATTLTTGATFTVGEIPFGDIDLMAPGRGANTFYTYTQSVKVPDANTVNWSLDNDVRFTWIQLQPGTSSSTYDWSTFDTNINYSISKGQRFSFRVMTLDTDAMSYSSQSTGGNKITYPLFVHTAMQGESVKDWTYGGSWIPNWNSPSYLSAWENFLKALASHINSGSYNGVPYKNVVYHIDISGFGNYGEFHSYPFINSYPSSAQKITDASYKRIVDAHISAFPNTPLIANVNMLVGTEMSAYDGWYSLTASNSWGKFGLRSDHLGNSVNFYYDTRDNTRSYNGLSFKNEILNRWTIAPICGEPINSSSTASSGGSCAFWNLSNEVNTYHMSQFSNTSPTAGTGCADDNFRAASKLSGYRLSVKGGSVSGKTVTLNWSNSGIAPVYENWDVYLEVRNGSTVVWSGMSSFKPKLFLPGTTSAATTIGNVASGTYSLYVIVKDPLGYRKPLTLANTNRLSDGSYKVADIKI